MSAFMVGDEHIDALLTAGIDSRVGGSSLSWYTVELSEEMTLEEIRTARRVLDYETADQVGAMLLAENRASVNYRYDEDDLEWVYEFHRLPGTIPPVAALKALACLEYQSCEHPGWKTSEARRFCDALRHAMIGRLSGYDDAPWEIIDRDVFVQSAHDRRMS